MSFGSSSDTGLDLWKQCTAMASILVLFKGTDSGNVFTATLFSETIGKLRCGCTELPFYELSDSKIAFHSRTSVREAMKGFE